MYLEPQFDSLSELFLKLSTLSVKFNLPHGSEVWLIAGDGCLGKYCSILIRTWVVLCREDPMSLCPLGSGQPSLQTPCTRASRVCNV